MIFGGRSHLSAAKAFVITLSEDRKECRKWLDHLCEQVSYGHEKSAHAIVAAFTWTGLERLGQAAADLATFPTAFQSGMTSPGRSRALGDTGASAPENWLWGNEPSACHAILILYAEDEAALTTLASAQTAAFGGSAWVRSYAIALQTLVGNGFREPFGFSDGVSQPLIRGTPQADAAPASRHVVAAGEFVLGYDTNSGNRRISPLVEASRDPSRILPAAASRGEVARHDLGRNGSFFVVRQLEQNVDAFNKSLKAAAAELELKGVMPPGLSGSCQMRFVAAKLVGRWQNGSSIVRNHTSPGPGKDNDFGFAKEDPVGLACPLGAHIRRANPRDSLDPETKNTLSITNSHRLLRVGRPYCPEAPGGPRGILFMCLNSDIELQFETVQQTWLNRADFHGLRHEVDPMLGNSDRSRHYTVPTENGPTQIEGLSNFVSVRGGAYFFMPGRAALTYLASRCG